jgi:hypothetical protein
MQLSALIKELKAEKDLMQRHLAGIDAALTAFANVYGVGKPTRKRRKMSAASRKKIAAAQRARWEKVRGKAKAATPKRKMSAKSRAKIAAAQRARWARVRAKRKS